MTTTSKHILVCGGAGYIGSHMVKMLAGRGHAPVVVDNLSAGHAEAVDCELVQGDVRDRAFLDAFFASRPRFDAVMHFSAKIVVSESVERPDIYYDNNVAGALTLLDAMRAHGADRFVFSSTAAVYGEPVQDFMDETHPIAPLNPYGHSKHMVEQALADYGAAFGLRSVAFRYFNAAGADPGGAIGEAHDPETHLIPNILGACMPGPADAPAGGSCPAFTLYGDDYDTPDGTCVRDYIHVNDICDAHLKALDHMERHEGRDIFNLGNGLGFSNLEVVKAVEEVTGLPVERIHGPRRSGDSPRLVADATRARETLGWKPRFTDIREIIETAWRWRRARRY